MEQIEIGLYFGDVLSRDIIARSQTGKAYDAPTQDSLRCTVYLLMYSIAKLR